MTASNIAQKFLNREPISGVRFEHNDCMRIIAGVNKGKFGSLVTVLEIAPEPKFVLELDSGFDIEVLQSEISMQTLNSSLNTQAFRLW